MNKQATRIYKNVCPRNCPSSCTMNTYVENASLAHITGDPAHPYTKGKLCAKGFSYIEKNSHRDRLKFPYYQKVKGSGKFRPITWEKAFDLIISEMINIHRRYGSFLPLSLYKGTGNIGVHHFVTDEFFSSLGETTRIIASPSFSASFKAIDYDLGAVKMSDPASIMDSSMVIIWGANPAATNIHLIPFIIEAKIKGAKIVVIDPVYTQTAELADLYIQLRPSTDGALATVLTKGLFEKNAVDKDFLTPHSYGVDAFFKMIDGINVREYLLKCSVPHEAIDLLLKWLTEAEAVSYVIGDGLSKHSNGGQAIRAIEALAVVRGDIGKTGGGIFFRGNDSLLFNNQDFNRLNGSNRLVHTSQLQESLPIDMMWISCANPLTQEPNSKYMEQVMKDIPFVVTVDHFLTPTAQMSNLVLPTTTHFEEMDVVMSWWHNELALNEKAISPYYESKSEWSMMKELALRLQQLSPELCSFPIHYSEEEYLNAQFNDKVFSRYSVQSVSDLRGSSTVAANLPKTAWDDRQFDTKTGKFQFYSEAAKQANQQPMGIFTEVKMPTNDYPFWLMTPHHPYAINSQFHFLHLSGEEEAIVEINPKAAKELNIFNGEIVTVFNEQSSIEIKAVYSHQVPKDIVIIYQRWYPHSQVTINYLVPAGPKGIALEPALYDTFVNIKKL
ncbi:molybdopterin-containing oxidoreductase family protein [Neobacillus kokaensis]|uniref:DMSO reductase subunit A n=1 Tax=Neobacillus kokaensis TaxID=2759023 RepID=A0ABQ3NA68_9BACI|nr:molybdopterin-dependent oxidoreductase [Neobacillus kokaensis]GHH99895.1 DMSO reductase subunit A [Neobacillus kokaensis]